MLTRLRLTPMLLLIVTILLSACGGGTDKPAAAPSGSTAPTASGAPSAEPARPIKDALGTVDIKGTPKRIVTLEWTYTENVLALGGTQVGAADIANYKKYVKIKQDLPADVQDVGTRQEPNLEKIAALKPDLIIGVKFRHEKILSQLKAIAPTLIFDPYSPTSSADQYKEMEETFHTIADALNKKPEAQKVMTDLTSKITQGADKVKAANKAGAEVVLTQAYSDQNAAVFRLFTPESLPGKILTKMGLKNAYSAGKVEMYGYSTAGVEALSTIQNANLLHIIQDSDNVIEKILKDNAVWKSLGFVKDNRLYALGGDTWPFGGPWSMETFVDRVVATLAK